MITRTLTKLELNKIQCC